MGKHEVKRRAVFLDRDGVINKPVIVDGRPHPPAKVEEFELYEDVPSAYAQLEAAGFLLVVVTNQPDVARGRQTRAAVEAMHRKMFDTLPRLSHLEVCWHAGDHWGDPCVCRKPQPGMVLRAAEALNIELSESFLIGDRWRDIDCGHEAGCRTVFIDRNYSESLKKNPDWIVNSFSEAVKVILNAAGMTIKSDLHPQVKPR
jgi:D-glycero-D-manno-heptose 1,7-bisphosphate phosphatase